VRRFRGNVSRFSKTLLVGLIAVFVGAGLLYYIRMRLARPTGKLETSVSEASREPGLPPGEPATIKFAAPNMSSAEPQKFLSADYRILGKVAELPTGIRELYKVKGGSGIAMADPGEKFESTDETKLVIQNYQGGD
jgi:hypothetical protein